jgi:hypothetical protein
MPTRVQRFQVVRNLTLDTKIKLVLRLLIVPAFIAAVWSLVLASKLAWIQAREYGYTAAQWQR